MVLKQLLATIPEFELVVVKIPGDIAILGYVWDAKVYSLETRVPVDLSEMENNEVNLNIEVKELTLIDLEQGGSQKK